MPMPTPIGSVRPNNLTLCDTMATPQCIAALYNITDGHLAARGNQLGIFEDLGDVYSQQDLDSFFTRLAPYIPNGTHPTLDAIDGAVAPVKNVSLAGYESGESQMNPLLRLSNTFLT